MRTLFYSFRMSLVYSLVFLLGFQPSALAIGDARMKRIEVALSQADFTKREVPLSEFMDTWGYTLPPAMQKVALQILAEDPNFKLPKINVQKVKGAAGKQNLQMGFTDKVAGSFSMFFEDDNGHVRMRAGGQNFSVRDWTHANEFMDKMALAVKADTKDLPSWVVDPNELSQIKILRKNEFNKLSKTNQNLYLKSVLNALVAVEKVQNAQLKVYELELKNSTNKSAKPKKTSQLNINQLFELLVAQANASGDADFDLASLQQHGKCLAAGHIVDWGLRSGSHYSCGANQSINCGNGGVACRQELFGHSKCAPNPREATSFCARQSESTFSKVNDLSDSELNRIQGLINDVWNGPCSSAQLSRVRDIESNRYPGTGLYQDQYDACQVLKLEINRARENANPEPTPGGNVGSQTPVITPTPEVTPIPAPAPTDCTNCPCSGSNGSGEVVANPPPRSNGPGEAAPGRSTPSRPPVTRSPCRDHDHRTDNERVRAEPSRNTCGRDRVISERLYREGEAVWGNCHNDAGANTCTKGDLTYYRCLCGDKKPVLDGSYIGCSSAKDDSRSSSRRSGGVGAWFKKNGKWLGMFFGGLVALWAYDRMYKKSLEENYRLNLPPTTTLPPAPTPPPPAPTPRP